jgi:phage shock protein A
MRGIGWCAVTAALALATSIGAHGQETGRVDPQPATLEERVEALERLVASLDTRLEARTTGARERGGLPETLLAQRIEQLERTVAAIRSDIQRIERTAELATRAASDAQRTAAAAERAARDAASRIR